MANPIYFFSKKSEYSEFSNFAPYGFVDAGVAWPTVEHYFQAMKFENSEYRERIRTAVSPAIAKTLGRSRAVPIRPDWDAVRETVMLHALRRKFADAGLRGLLLSTKNRELVEASPFDKYWGAGKDGKGKNRLGHLLMQVRAELSRT